MKWVLPVLALGTAAAFAEPAPISPERNREAVSQLRRAIDERYSHRDRVVKDWAGRFAAAAPALEAAKSASEFATGVVALLSAAEDPHLNVLADGKQLPTFLRHPIKNGDPKRLPKALASFKQESNWVLTGRTREGFGYLLIAQWPAPDSPLMAPVHAAIDAFIAEKLPAVIVDVRVNGGGNDLSALGVAGRFARNPGEFCRIRTRDHAQPGGWTPWRPRALNPAPESKRFGGRVAVLCGPVCMSSNESFILMMKAAGAKIVGARTFGSSGNPKPVDLGNGVTVMLPSWEVTDVQGQPLEGRGIEPDLAAEFEDGSGGDGVLTAAIRELLAS